MGAPDKIYIEHEYTDNTTLPCGVNWENRTNDNDTCYIRKDALLEWAKKELEGYIKDDFGDGTEDSLFWGQKRVLRKLIDKLNQM